MLQTSAIIKVPKNMVKCLNEWISINQGVDRLVKEHMSPFLNPLQFVYHLNHSTDDVLHLSLELMEEQGNTHVQMLFVSLAGLIDLIDDDLSVTIYHSFKLTIAEEKTQWLSEDLWSQQLAGW